MYEFSQRDSAGVLSVPEAAQIIDATYRAIGLGQVEASEPSMMRIGSTPFRLGAKGAVLHHRGIAGVRLTSRAAPRLMLWSLKSGEPIAFFDESEMYRFRTGVSAAVVARYLLQSRPLERAAIVGAGPIARQVASAIHQLLKPKEIAVKARSRASAERFASDAAARGEPVVVADDVASATRDSGLIVSITSANEELIRPEHVFNKAIVLSMGGGLETSHEVWASASARYVDDLSYALHQGDAAAWIKAGAVDPGELQESLTGTVGELAAGVTSAPVEPARHLMAIVQGTTALDVALAHSIFISRAGVQELG